MKVSNVNDADVAMVVYGEIVCIDRVACSPLRMLIHLKVFFRYMTKI